MENITEDAAYLVLKPSEKLVEHYVEYTMPPTEGYSDIRIILRDKELKTVIEDAKFFL